MSAVGDKGAAHVVESIRGVRQLDAVPVKETGSSQWSKFVWWG